MEWVFENAYHTPNIKTEKEKSHLHLIFDTSAFLQLLSFQEKNDAEKSIPMEKGEEFPLDMTSLLFFSFLAHVWSEQNKKADQRWGQSGSKIYLDAIAQSYAIAQYVYMFLWLLIRVFLNHTLSKTVCTAKNASPFLKRAGRAHGRHIYS